jgi:hypothetical protein
MDKLSFKGLITSIQPRIRLTRSFDEASHTYLGYAIKIAGTIDNQQVTFSIGIGKAAQAKFNRKRQIHSDVNYNKSGSSTPSISQRALLTAILKSSSDMSLA